MYTFASGGSMISRGGEGVNLLFGQNFRQTA